MRDKKMRTKRPNWTRIGTPNRTMERWNQNGRTLGSSRFGVGEAHAACGRIRARQQQGAGKESLSFLCTKDPTRFHRLVRKSCIAIQAWIGVGEFERKLQSRNCVSCIPALVQSCSLRNNPSSYTDCSLYLYTRMSPMSPIMSTILLHYHTCGR